MIASPAATIEPTDRSNSPATISSVVGAAMMPISAADFEIVARHREGRGIPRFP